MTPHNNEYLISSFAHDSPKDLQKYFCIFLSVKLLTIFSFHDD